MRETSHQAFARADGGQWAVPVITGLGGPAFMPPCWRGCAIWWAPTTSPT